MVVFVSPRFAVIEITRVESTTRHAASRPPFTTNDTMPPPLRCWRIGQRVLRMAGQPGIVDALHARMGLQPARELERAGAVRVHAQLERLQALEDHPGVERRQRRAGGAQERGERIVDQRAPCPAPRRPAPGPARRDTWWPSESRGRRPARAAAAAPACRSSCPPRAARRADARAAPAPRYRYISVSGLDGVSRNSRRVFGFSAASPRRGLGACDEGGLDSEPRQPVVEQLHGGAEQAARGNDVLAGLAAGRSRTRGSPTCPRRWRRSTRRPRAPRGAPAARPRSDWCSANRPSRARRRRSAPRPGRRSRTRSSR